MLDRENDDVDVDDVDGRSVEETPQRGTTVSETCVDGIKNSRIIADSLIPWIRVYLFVEQTNSKGIKVKFVRTQVAVALTKLIMRLSVPVVTIEKKNTLISNLIINVVGTLKGVDVNARDQARDSLCKMVQTMGLQYLYMVLYELKHHLKEGYQLHVRNYTVRSILSTVLSSYIPDKRAKSAVNFEAGCLTCGNSDLELYKPELDKCIPLVMESVLDDLVGKTRDDITHDGLSKKQFREKKGNKANDTLEIIARCILFRPSYALCGGDPTEVSSVHALVIPLIDCLTANGSEEKSANDDFSGRIRRVSEALKSVASGFAKNTSILPEELLLYLHATLQPFVSGIIRDIKQQKRLSGRLVTENDINSGVTDDSDEFFSTLPSYLYSGSDEDDDFGIITQSMTKKAKVDPEGIHTFQPKIWLPFEYRHEKSQEGAITTRINEAKERDSVIDGAQAPKRTGYGNQKSMKRSRRGDVNASKDPMTLTAVKFCLTLLNSAIKNNVFEATESVNIQVLATPFLPLLGQCLYLPGATSIATLALKCLCSMLGWDLEIDAKFARVIATKILHSIIAGGSLISADNELVQGYLKGLTSLFLMSNARRKKLELESEKNDLIIAFSEDGNMDTPATNQITSKLPLSIEDIRSLVGVLTIAILETTGSHQVSTFQLVKAIIESRLVIPEIYDLVTKLVDQIVLSHTKGVRDACITAVISFMLNFPVGNKRLLALIKHLINNCSFEFEAGRISALSVVQTITKLLPLPVLQDVSTMIFFPMVQACVSDCSSSCRKSASDVLLSLCRRVDVDTFYAFLKYALLWTSTEDASCNRGDILTPSTKTKNKMLIKTGYVVGSLTVAARPDLWKKGSYIHEWIKFIRQHLLQMTKIDHNSSVFEEVAMVSLEEKEGVGDAVGVSDWALVYNLLILLDKMLENLPTAVESEICSISFEQPKPIYMMDLVQEMMMYPHSWVRMVSLRILSRYCCRRDALKGKSGLSLFSEYGEFLCRQGGLFSFGRKLCVVLNMMHVPDKLLSSSVCCLVFVINALVKTIDTIDNSVERRKHRGICSDNDNKSQALTGKILGADTEMGSGGNEHIESDCESSESDSDCVNGDVYKNEKTIGTITGHHWIMQRLRGIGNDSRGNRRLHVLQVE